VIDPKAALFLFRYNRDDPSDGRSNRDAGRADL